MVVNNSHFLSLLILSYWCFLLLSLFLFLHFPNCVFFYTLRAMLRYSHNVNLFALWCKAIFIYNIFPLNGPVKQSLCKHTVSSLMCLFLHPFLQYLVSLFISIGLVVSDYCVNFIIWYTKRSAQSFTPFWYSMSDSTLIIRAYPTSL